MTSFKQIDANRRNARQSTCPNTQEGKLRSRRSVRHGLTAETVIGALEHGEDYKAFEAIVMADYDAQSALERELVLRVEPPPWSPPASGTSGHSIPERDRRHLYCTLETLPCFALKDKPAGAGRGPTTPESAKLQTRASFGGDWRTPSLALRRSGRSARWPG
jgi:hypothetical protein